MRTCAVVVGAGERDGAQRLSLRAVLMKQPLSGTYHDSARSHSCPLSPGSVGERVRVRGSSVESILHGRIALHTVSNASSEAPLTLTLSPRSGRERGPELRTCAVALTVPV